MLLLISGSITKFDVTFTGAVKSEGFSVIT